MANLAPLSRDVVDSLEKATTADEQLAVLRSVFQVDAVQPGHRFDQDTVYFVVGRENNHLIRTATPAIADDHLHFTSCLHERPMKPLSIARVEAAIQQQRLYLVQPRPRDMTERDHILDRGGFSQLIDAAQRSGLVQGISTIVQVRDCEFRLGRHQQALQLVESLYQGFLGRAAQRAQRLAREDMDIASGRIRMSPKELQAKRFRDRQQTQCIERARTRFSRVIEGLRTIIQRGL